MTHEEAIGKATQLLEWASGETDLAKMAALNDLADSWINIAVLYTGIEHD